MSWTPLVALAVEPTPAPDPDRPPDELIGPGIAGFVAIFLLSAAVILLIRDMNRRVQRMRYRQSAREAADPSPPDASAEDRDGRGAPGAS
jgi:hypothetical protein